MSKQHASASEFSREKETSPRTSSSSSSNNKESETTTTTTTTLVENNNVPLASPGARLDPTSSSSSSSSVAATLVEAPIPEVAGSSQVSNDSEYNATLSSSSLQLRPGQPLDIEQSRRRYCRQVLERAESRGEQPSPRRKVSENDLSVAASTVVDKVFYLHCFSYLNFNHLKIFFC